MEYYVSEYLLIHASPNASAPVIVQLNDYIRT
jgi:hypothetical protein